MILCFSQETGSVERLREQIKEMVSKTPYSCAIGVAYADGQADFNKLCSRADKSMYEDKKSMKA